MAPERRPSTTTIFWCVVAVVAPLCIGVARSGVRFHKEVWERPEAREAARLAASGVLPADGSGAVRLPARFAALAADGKVYVTRRKGGESGAELVCVYFPEVLWLPASDDGYLWCSRALLPADLAAAPSGEYSGNPPPPAVEVVSRAGKLSMVIERQHLGNWYTLSHHDN